MAKVKKEVVKKPTTKKKVTTKSKVKSVVSKAKKSEAKITKKAPVKKPKIKKSLETKKPKHNKFQFLKVVGIAAFIVILILLLLSFMSKDSSSNLEETSIIDTTLTTTNQLVILEDPSCDTCQVDFFASQVKQNLIPDLNVKKISYNSEQGSKAISDLGLNFVPTYLFSTDIDQREDWDETLSSVFIKVNILDGQYYLLNPQLVENKVLVKDLEVLEGSIVLGNPDAKVTVYEFSDYECPFCAVAEGSPQLLEEFQKSNPTYNAPVPQLMENYVKTGKIKYVFYNFPIEQLHPQSITAHLSAMCANDQDMWIEFHNKLFESRSEWIDNSNKADLFKTYAIDLGLDEDTFNTCLDSKTHINQIKKEVDLGISYGVKGTPGFFINKNFISGAQDYSVFEAIIEEELNK